MAALAGDGVLSQLDVWQQLVANSELWPLLQPGQPMETLCSRPDLGVVRVAPALGGHWVVKMTLYGDNERQSQIDAEHEASLAVPDCPMLPVVQGVWAHDGVVYQVQDDAGLSLDKMCREPGWVNLPPKDKAQAVEQIIADGCTAQSCNVGRKHSDVKLANLCICAPDHMFQRSRCTTIDQGGSSWDDGSSGGHLETTDITPEPGLAAPSSVGPGKVYNYALESIAATTAKADVSALGFSVLELLLPGGLPAAMTMTGVLARGVSAEQARAVVLDARLEFCEWFVAGRSPYSEVQQLICWLQAECPLLLDLLQHMLQPDASVRWSAEQVMQHPCVRPLAAQRCIELLHGRAAWQQHIQAMQRELARIPNIKLAAANSGSSSSSNGWDTEVARVLGAITSSMASNVFTATLQAATLQADASSLQQQKADLLHQNADLLQQNGDLLQQNGDLQQQLHQVNIARAADMATLQDLLCQERQMTLAAVEAQGKAEAHAADLSRKHKQEADLRHSLQQRLLAAELQVAAADQGAAESAAPPASASCIVKCKLQLERQQQQEPKPPQKQQRHQRCILVTAAAGDEGDDEFFGASRSSSSDSGSSGSSSYGGDHISSSSDVIDSSNGSSSRSGKSSLNCRGGRCSSTSTSSSSSSRPALQCATGLACAVAAVPAGGDESALQPSTPVKDLAGAGHSQGESGYIMKAAEHCSLALQHGSRADGSSGRSSSRLSGSSCSSNIPPDAMRASKALAAAALLGPASASPGLRPAAAPETADAQVQTDLLHTGDPGPLGVEVSWSSSPAVQAGCLLVPGRVFQDWINCDGGLSSHGTWSGPRMDHQTLAVLAAAGSIVPGQAARTVTCATFLKAMKKSWGRCCRVLKDVLHLPCTAQA